MPHPLTCGTLPLFSARYARRSGRASSKGSFHRSMPASLAMLSRPFFSMVFRAWGGCFWGGGLSEWIAGVDGCSRSMSLLTHNSCGECQSSGPQHYVCRRRTAPPAGKLLQATRHHRQLCAAQGPGAEGAKAAYLSADAQLDPALALLPVDLLVLQVGLLPLAVVLVGEGHNVGLVALLAWRADGGSSSSRAEVSCGTHAADAVRCWWPQ